MDANETKQRRGRGEGGVGRRPDGKWYATASCGVDADGRRLRKYFYGDSKTEVTKARNAWLKNQEAGFNPSSETLAQYLDAWLAELRPTARVNTYANYEWAVVKTLRPYLGAVKLGALQPAHLDRFIKDAAAAGKSPNAINYALTVLKRALRKAYQQSRLVRDPFLGLERPKHTKRAITTWSAEEAGRFLAANTTDDRYPLWVLALYTGMREGELLGLQWHEVDLKTATVRITEQLIERKGVIYGRAPVKTVKGRRTIALPAPAVDALKKAYAAATSAPAGTVALHGPTVPWVFPNERGGPHHKANIHRHFKAAVRRAGVPEIRIHDLRHTSATLTIAALGKAGATVVQERLGHSDLRITLGTYVHPDADTHRAAAEVIGGLFGSGTPTK